MGTYSIAQTEELYWLGRYLERVKMTLNVFSGLYGKILDDVKLDVDGLCRQLAIPNVYGDIDTFSKRYLFDEEDPNSIISNMGRAFDNAIVLRDIIHTPTLAYVQLAYDTMESGSASASPMLEVQQAVDYLYAFWGALGDFVEDPCMRNTVRLGASVERVDLSIRLGLGEARISQEIARLADRLYRSQLAYNGPAFQKLLETAERGHISEHAEEALSCVEGLVSL